MGKSIASLILSHFTFFPFFGIPFAIVGLILGCGGISYSKLEGEPKGKRVAAKVMGIIGVIFNIIGLVYSTIVGLLIVIAEM